MRFGPKTTLTNPSAIGASAYPSFGSVPKMTGALGIITRLWLNADGAGDRVISDHFCYPVGADGATTAVQSWKGVVSGAGVGGTNFVLSGAIAKASVQDVPPAQAKVSLISLMTGGILPCPFATVKTYIGTTTGGATDYTAGKVVMECWPIYPDGHPEGVYSNLPDAGF